MLNIIDWLKGKKTYILSVLTALYGVLVAFGVIVITPNQEIAVWAFIGALFGITIRAGMKKSA